MSKRGDWITTFTGKQFYPFDPQPEEICIEDIAHALALTNRFGGHTPYPYSVAQHSYLLALAAPNGNELAALLHDAPEAYLTDVPRPIKRNPAFSLISDVEDTIYKAIALAVPHLPPVIPDVVHEFDTRLLVTEAHALLSGYPWWLESKWPQRLLSVPIQPWHWKDAEKNWLYLYHGINP